MNACVLTVAVCLALVAVPAAAAEIDFSQSDEEAVKAAETAWASSIAEAKEAGSSATIRAVKRDLNGDGKPEIVGLLQCTYLCRSPGCFFLMRDMGSGFDVVFSVPGVESVEVLDSKTQGWLDLKFNDENRWGFNGTGYSLQ